MSSFSSAAINAFRDPASVAGSVLKSPGMRGFVRFVPFDLTNYHGDEQSSSQPTNKPVGYVWEDQSVPDSYVLKIFDGAAWQPVIRALEVSFSENAAWNDADADSARVYTFRGFFAGESEYAGSYLWKAPSVPMSVDGQLFDLLCRSQDWEFVPSQEADPQLSSQFRW